jgi:hypothetical protein
MKTLLLRIVLAVLGLLKRRAEAKAAQTAVEAHRVEAVRKDAAIRETVADMGDGAARKELSRDWNRLGVLLFLGLSLSACATPAPVIVDTSCDWVRPILVSDADQITDATARDILAHNKSWALRCRRK